MIHNQQIKILFALSLSSLFLFTGCGGGGGGGSRIGDKDSDGDGILNSVDVDDDNNGLIEIHNLKELDEIRNRPDGTSLNGDSTGCPTTKCNGYELVANLDFDTNHDGVVNKLDGNDSWDTDPAGWKPIGIYSTPDANAGTGFNANFNGNGYVIRNLTINRPSVSGADPDPGIGIGLFAEVDGKAAPSTGISTTIQNLTLENVNIIGGSVVGALAGHLNDQTIENNLIISNCSASGTVIGKGDYVGGLVGISNGSTTTIELSDASVDVSNGDYVNVNDPNTYVYGVGGLVGFAMNGTTITNSYAIGKVTGYHAVGGLIGDINYFYRTNISVTYPTDKPVTISQSYATGDVTATALKAGGLIGYAYHVQIDNTFATGAVTAEYSMGGLAGQIANTPFQAGNMQPNIVEHSYAVNSVNPTGASPTEVGGFVGAGDSAHDTYTANYFANDTSPTTLKCIGDGTDKDGVCKGIALIDLEGPTKAPDSVNCLPTDLYCHWNATTTIWDFGTNSQLPGLILNGVTHWPLAP